MYSFANFRGELRRYSSSVNSPSLASPITMSTAPSGDCSRVTVLVTRVGVERGLGTVRDLFLGLLRRGEGPLFSWRVVDLDRLGSVDDGCCTGEVRFTICGTRESRAWDECFLSRCLMTSLLR